MICFLWLGVIVLVGVVTLYCLAIAVSCGYSSCCLCSGVIGLLWFIAVWWWVGWCLLVVFGFRLFVVCFFVWVCVSAIVVG